MMSREQKKGGRMSGGQGQEKGKTDREKRGNYCSMNGIQSNFLLLKKSFIYVDSLLVMYLSVTPPPTALVHTQMHRHTHFPPSHSQCVCLRVVSVLCVCVYDEAVLLILQGWKLEGREVVLNCTDKINM